MWLTTSRILYPWSSARSQQLHCVISWAIAVPHWAFDIIYHPGSRRRPGAELIPAAGNQYIDTLFLATLPKHPTGTPAIPEWWRNSLEHGWNRPETYQCSHNTMRGPVSHQQIIFGFWFEQLLTLYTPIWTNNALLGSRALMNMSNLNRVTWLYAGDIFRCIIAIANHFYGGVLKSA